MSAFLRRTAAALTAAAALTLVGTAPALAEGNSAEPATEAHRANPLVLLSPGAHVHSGSCDAATELEQEPGINNSGNVPVLSDVLGTQDV